jgi:hypothetical protein
LSGWCDFYFRVLTQLAPTYASAMLGGEVKSPLLASLWSSEYFGSDSDWEPSENWIDGWHALTTAVSMYMAGLPLSKIAALLFSEDEYDDVSNSRGDGQKPIPRTVGLVNSLFDKLSRYAGALVAIFETRRAIGEGVNPSGESLKALLESPLALKYGCDTTSTLAWFRFGIRFRRLAHALSARFPVPPDIVDDSARKNWVSEQRRRWLWTLEWDPDGFPVREERRLELAKAVLTGGA